MIVGLPSTILIIHHCRSFIWSLKMGDVLDVLVLTSASAVGVAVCFSVNSRLKVRDFLKWSSTAGALI